VQTPFGGPTPNSVASGKIKDSMNVWKNTPILAKEFLGRSFLWWYWGIYFLLKVFGFSLIYSIGSALFCLIVICLTYGFLRARALAEATSMNTRLLGSTPTAGASPWNRPVVPHPSPRSITTTDPIVGNLALSIYHLQNCDWVQRISNKNRINFSSTAEALSAGYKPCRICTPAS
jgi:micrococcal nuclease